MTLPGGERDGAAARGNGVSTKPHRVDVDPGLDSHEAYVRLEREVALLLRRARCR